MTKQHYKPPCAAASCWKHGKPKNAVKIANGFLYYCEHHWHTIGKKMLETGD